MLSPAQDPVEKKTNTVLKCKSSGLTRGDCWLQDPAVSSFRPLPIKVMGLPAELEMKVNYKDGQRLLIALPPTRSTRPKKHLLERGGV